MKSTLENNRKLPRSVKKYIRREKSRIRRIYSDTLEINSKVKELMNKFNG